MISDTIANSLTKIRNASSAGHSTVEVASSKFMNQILNVLKQEGFIRNYKQVGAKPKQTLKVYLKYVDEQTPAISKIIRASKPGQRTYRSSVKMPRVLGGLGRAIVTTSKGVMTDHEARRQKVGGEVLCYVW